MARETSAVVVTIQHQAQPELAADLKRRGLADVQIRVDAFATLNGRPSQRLVNPDIDLAGTLPPGWILPFNLPVPRILPDQQFVGSSAR